MKNNKSLGQHWLKNRQILDQIAVLASPEGLSAERCLEIGPGLGTLTSTLLRRFKAVTAVEFDANLAANLPKSFPGKKLTVIHQDFLNFNLQSISQPYSVVGNIPYYITSPIIQKLLKSSNAPQIIVLLIQKEVAQRIVAERGHHTLLSLSVQNLASATLGPLVSKSEFVPPPKVDSQVIILEPHLTPIIPPDAFSFIKIGFSSPRKKLLANLTSGLALEREQLKRHFDSLAIDHDVRPADLDLLTWAALQQAIKH